MDIRIVFVHIVTGATVSYSHGIASLVSVLLRAGFQARHIALVTIRRDPVQSYVKQILEYAPSVVLFSAMSNQWVRATELANVLKTEDPSLPLCIGGAHATACPESVRDSSFDWSFVGEAEHWICQLVQAASESLASLRDLGRKIELAGRRFEALDGIPLPYLPIFDPADVLAYPSVMFSRGCPYQCSYCMSRLGGGGDVRWKSPARAIREVVDLDLYCRPEEIYFDDDTLLKNPKWVLAFCDQYAAECGKPFYCNARAETVKEGVVRALKRANCVAIGIGIESGSERLRSEVLLRRMSDRVLLRAFDTARSAGLKTWSFNMVGLPGETAEDFETTISLNERAQPDFVRVSIFTAYPGTPAYDLVNPDQYARPYIRGSGEISLALRPQYQEWISKLKAEGRLWFTEFEEVAVQEVSQSRRRELGAA